MSEMAQDTESGGVLAADGGEAVIVAIVEAVVEDVVVKISEDDDVPPANENDDDFVCAELEATKESREENHILDTIDAGSAAMMNDEPAAQEQTTADVRDAMVNANAAIEPSSDGTEYKCSADIGEDPGLIGERVVIPPDDTAGDCITGPDDDSDATEDYTFSSPDEPVDMKAGNMQTVRTDETLDEYKYLNDAGKESDNDVVIDESSHGTNTIQPKREHSNHEDDTMFSLDRDKGCPVENDEEMAQFPVNVDDMIEDVHTEDQRPSRRCRSFMLVACIAAIAIIAAVIVTSIDRGRAEESLPSSSSSTATITEDGEGVDDVLSSSIPSSPSDSQESPSIQPSFDPSAPSSQYQWLQNAIDNYVGNLQDETNEETATSLPSLILEITHNPTSKPTTATATQPPLTANPNTFKPTTAKPTTSNPTLSTPSPTSRPTIQPTTTKPTAIPTPHPSTAPPTSRPTIQPTTANPTAIPTPQPSTASPTIKPTMQPVPNATTLSNLPPPQQRKGCITNIIYDEIDRDIELLKNGISGDEAKAHFLGGIVRLVAHDFMDFDRNSANSPMGPDGCFDPSHPANAGLPEDLWCEGCLLTNLYQRKYSERQISRADFWIASANAVIRQTSVNNGLDLRDTFEWGRVDANSCAGQGSRIPSPRGCSQTEDAFLTRMGLTWTDATALMGAHTLGRGDTDFSGHHGTWVPSNTEAMLFDKTYYEEVFLNSWHPQRIGTPTEDWTTGNGGDRVMLNTDLCLVMLIDENMPCCTGTRCTGLSRRCPRIPANHPRSEAFDAFEAFLGGGYPNDNQAPFYNAFREAWGKATKLGQNNLFPLADNCDIE